VKLGKNARYTCAMLSKAYGGEAMERSSVSEWHNDPRKLGYQKHI
jgi:hypothetical protein